MKKKMTGNGLLIPNKFRIAGMTVYHRQGQLITRTSHSTERRSNTLRQFVYRQKMRHAVELWKMLRFCETKLFTRHRTAYQGFMSLANRLQAVYVPDDGLMGHASFLMPGIPMSDGTLPEVKQQLGEVGGIAALTTDLEANDYVDGEQLLLYTAEQCIENKLPRVRFSMYGVSRSDMTETEGRLALVNEEFANEMKGWALVQVVGDRCSSQALVTRCNYYQPFTTGEALERAAQSYGGLTDPDW